MARQPVGPLGGGCRFMPYRSLRWSERRLSGIGRARGDLCQNDHRPQQRKPLRERREVEQWKVDRIEANALLLYFLLVQCSSKFCSAKFAGAGGGNRTPTGLPLLDFESSAASHNLLIFKRKTFKISRLCIKVCKSCRRPVTEVSSLRPSESRLYARSGLPQPDHPQQGPQASLAFEGTLCVSKTLRSMVPQWVKLRKGVPVAFRLC